MKSFRILLFFIICMMSLGLQAKNVLSSARIYINPGHGGWGPNDRPLATINYAVMDTLGFFETKSNLWQAEGLRDELLKAGAGYVRMSRTQNGIAPSSQSTLNKYEKKEGNGQIVTLSVMCQDVEANNMDYFISIHTNAATEGSTTNYSLLLYRGTDAAVGNGLADAKSMANDAWKYIVKNDLTYISNYITTTNIRGDVSFYGSGSSSMGYYGYLGALKHGCDGFLSEGCFHTYQPERQRLLNRDYCRQMGMRYARAVRAWFGDDTETKGCIMGSVKDMSKSLKNSLYNYKAGTNDEYYPLNNATVILEDANDQEIGRYTTDKEYNGVFVFTGLQPGNYKLFFYVSGYNKDSADITVKANETAFIKEVLDGSKPVTVQPIIPPLPNENLPSTSSLKFQSVGGLKTVDALANLTVRRAILRDGKYYVLAVNSQKTPKLLVIDPETGALIKEMSTAGLITEGYQKKAYPYILSDIAFTDNGVLLGANSTVVAKESNAYQTGNFYVYKWEAKGTTALEDATPAILLQLPTNTSNSLVAAGNNNSNFMANSIVVNGSSDNFNLYFDSHPGNDWTTNYAIRHVGWNVKNGVVTKTQYNGTRYSISTSGEDVRMSLSPLGPDRYLLDGNKMYQNEMQFSWSTNTPTYSPDFAGISLESTGSTFFNYGGKVYMSAPVCEKQKDNTYSYRSFLFDVTNGLNNAEKIAETDAIITGESAVKYMTSPGVVDNGDISIYLLVGNKLIKYKSVSSDATGVK